MKFRNKIYFCVLILFLLALDTGAYALLRQSYQQIRQIDVQRGLTEYQLISQTLSHLIAGIDGQDASSDLTLYQLVSSFSRGNPGTELELYRDGNLLFTNTVDFEGNRPELDSVQPTIQYRKLDGRLRLYVGGRLPHAEMLSLSISHDSHSLANYYQSLLTHFIWISVLLSLVLSVALLFLLQRLLRPMEQLSSAANEIADGHYAQRVSIKQRDEIGQLAQDFNKMAEAVAGHIQELTRLNAEKEEFIHSLTHELKTPIATIHGYSDFLQRANCSEEERALALYYIQEHTIRLEQLGGRLLQLLQLRTQALSLQTVSVAALFDSMQTLAQGTLQRCGVSLSQKIQTTSLYGDPVLLQTALLNLIENAAKASPPKSIIMLHSYRAGHCICLAVTDYGCGIPEKELEHVCDEFYRVDKSRSRTSGGLGLGLSICRRVAQLHGGSLKLDSRPSEGTTALLYIPVQQQTD